MIHSLKVNETVILKVNETPFEKFHLQLELRKIIKRLTSSCFVSLFVLKWLWRDIMLDSINGKVSDVYPSYVVISVGGIGFKVNTPNPYSFNIDEEIKVYLYNYIKEDEYSLYGFKTNDERELFLKLIGVKGLGPKTALGILAGSTTLGVMDAIDRENILYLQKFPKVGEKLARQIILDLKGKLTSSTKNEVNNELVEALVSLGYKRNDILKITKDIDNTKTIEEQIKDALKLLFR